MLKRRLMSIFLTSVMITAILLVNNGGTPEKAAASTGTPAGTDNGSILDTPFQTTTDGSARVTIDGTKFMVGGKELWFNGANTPWNSWNDFGGTNSSGKSTFDQYFWDQHFEQLHKNGINATRVWISCNGDVGMKINSDGSFEGATDLFWKDMDTLVSLAEKYQIYLMATVQSFDHYKSSNKNYQSWRKLIQDDTKTEQYVDNFIVPLVKRYDSSDYFWSVDLCNEPDWVYENAECGKISWDNLSNYFAKAAAAIHKNSDVLVTVGLAMPKYNSDFYEGNVISDKNLQSFTEDKASYVDYYSTHWYSWEKPWFDFPFDKSPEKFKLDGTKPSVIGECAAISPSDKETLKDKYQLAYKNGWNGVFAWKTSGGNDGCGLLYDVTPATNAMLDIAKDKIFPLTTTLTSITDFKVKLSGTTFTYKGTSLKPSVTVTKGTVKLVEGTDYRVEYSSNNQPGTAKLTVNGIRDYTGTISKTFTIKLGAAKVSLAAGTDKATVKWSKVAGASGYEISMATTEDGTYSLIKRIGSAVNSYTKTGLITGQTYYFKVRAYTLVNGKKTYGSYSTVKYTKVK